MTKFRLIALSIIFYLVVSLGFAQMAKPSTDAASWGTWFVDADAIAAMVEAPTDSLRETELQQLIALSRQVDDMKQTQINYWNTSTPMYRWLEELHNTYNGGPPSPGVGRTMMLVSTGMYDAVVTTMKARKATGMLASPSGEGHMAMVPLGDSSFPSEHAAVATVVAELIKYANPDAAAGYQAMADEAMQSRLLAGANFQSDIDAGVMIGKAVAAQIIETVQSDGSDAPWNYVKPEGSLFAVESPVYPETGNWRPLVLESGSQFRAPPPPAYDSEQLAAELAEIQAFQEARAFPVVQQATYWATFYTAYKIWNDFISDQLFEQRMADNTALAAHMYATMGVGFYDSIIACFDSKYAYAFARPVHIDPSLKTIVPTPPHPSYPSAHSCASSASAHILAHYFPHDAEEALGMAAAAGQSRIFGGIHWQADNQAGLPIGESVAGVVIAKAMSMVGHGDGMSQMGSDSMMTKSPEDLARSYIAARNAYTMDRSIMTDGVKIVELGDSLSVEDVESWLKYAQAQGLRWFVKGCETKTAATVDCSFAMANKVSDAYGYGQVDGGVFQFSIDGQEISAVNLDINLSFWGPEVFRPAMEYIEGNHSENLDKMFTEKGTIGISDEGLELWRTYTDEFVEVVKAANN